MAFAFNDTTNYFITYNTSNMSFTGTVRRQGMNTKVVRLAAGYVGVVSAVVDGRDEPVADTKPRKTLEAAEKAAKSLAIKIAKRGL